MNSEGLKKIEEIYHAALEIPPDERESFIKKLCGKDAELRCEIESLLSFNKTSDQLLNTPPASLAAEMFFEQENFIGKEIGHYKIQRLLGKGGMGDVYLAEDTKLKRQVALKFLPTKFAENTERMSRFVREARSASGLNHPNIITIYEINEFEGKNFIASEFIDGKTLSEYLKINSPEIDSALEIAVQIASALDEAHSAGIIHRDIKPDNIMIRANGLVKILDFGIAKLSGRENAKKARKRGKKEKLPVLPSSKTELGIIIGTPNYMSPEQAGGKEIDTRTDIYSFGVVLYEMLTGQTPFEAETYEQTVANILKTGKPPISSLIKDYPPELERILSKTLAHKPADRFQTARELAASLKKLQQYLNSDNKFFLTDTTNEKVSSITKEQNAVDTDDNFFSHTALAEPQNNLPKVEAAAKNKHRYQSLRMISLLVLGVLFIGLATFDFPKYFGSKFETNPPRSFNQPLKQTRLTTLGRIQEGTISPDGKYLAYILHERLGKSIYLRNITDNKTTNILPSTELDCLYLKFSPDGKYIYFLQSADKEKSSFNDLYRMETSGGEPQKLIEDVDSAVSFSPDGKEFVFRRNSQVEKKTRLFTADFDGANEREFAVRPLSDGFVNEPVWSPDGKTIATFVGDKSTGITRISLLAINAADGRQERIGELLPFWAKSVVWMPDGKALLLTGQVEHSGPYQILRMSYPNGKLSNISNDFIDYRSVSITADGKSLVTVKNEKKINIFVAPFDDMENMRQLTSVDGVEFRGIDWTPDGRIVYGSNDGSNHNIWIMNRDGTQIKQLTHNGFQNYDPAVSPDGRYIVYVSTVNNEYHVWRMDMDGSNPLKLTGAEEDFDPAITPDGKSVIYTSIAPKGPYSMIWKVPIAGGKPVKLTDGTSRYPVVSPDGRLVAFKYWKGDKSLNGLSIIPVSGGTPKELNFNPDVWRWTADSKGLIYADSTEGFSNLFQMDLSEGKTSRITDFKSEIIFGFNVSTDGRDVVFLRGTTNSDVIMISNLD